jgi:Fur family transcriptional regulator, ferric uptake regulator
MNPRSERAAGAGRDTGQELQRRAPRAPMEALSRAIAAKGLRRSRQRDAIARTFFLMGGHVPVESLVEAVRREQPGVSVATVYRTMKLLSECGLAVPRDFGDGRARYEPAHHRHAHSHDHLICTGCGEIAEFESPQIEALQRRLARRHGFEVERRHVELYGRCGACRDLGKGESAA